MNEWKDKIESLQQELQEVESSYQFQVDRIDSQLGKIKGSLLETLALLTPSPRKTLRQWLAEYFSFPTEWLGKNLWTFISLMLILQAIIFAILVFSQKEHWATPTPDKTAPAVLTMTQPEYDLLRSAENLVNKDVGKFVSIGNALSAFYAESPMSVRDSVLERLGNVKSLDDLPSAMENVLGRVVITGGSVEGSLSPSIIDISLATDEDEPDTPGLLEESVEKEPPTALPEKKENNVSETPATEKTEYQRQRILRRR